MADLDLRGQFLYANPFRSEDMELELPSGKVTVRLRAPTVAERNRILSAVKDQDAAGITDAQALCCVLCCRKPEGDGLVFGEDDLPALRSMPAGGWVDAIASRVMSLINEGSAAAKK
jgi:hypothetical protein